MKCLYLKMAHSNHTDSAISATIKRYIEKKNQKTERRKFLQKVTNHLCITKKCPGQYKKKKKKEQSMRYANHYWDEKNPNYKVESCPTRDTNKKKKKNAKNS